MPTSTSTKRVTEKLHEKIVYEYLKLVVLKFLKNAKKSALKDGNMQKEEIEVCGRKINLLSIRKEMYHQEKKYMQLRPNISLSENP